MELTGSAQGSGTRSVPGFYVGAGEQTQPSTELTELFSEPRVSVP